MDDYVSAVVRSYHPDGTLLREYDSEIEFGGRYSYDDALHDVALHEKKHGAARVQILVDGEVEYEHS